MRAVAIAVILGSTLVVTLLVVTLLVVAPLALDRFYRWSSARAWRRAGRHVASYTPPPLQDRLVITPGLSAEDVIYFQMQLILAGSHLVVTTEPVRVSAYGRHFIHDGNGPVDVDTHLRYVKRLMVEQGVIS